jgi:hypothetical protein
MKATLGHDWLDYFDLCAANCHKPIFYTGQSPFFLYDQKKSNLKGKKVDFSKDIVGKMVLEGNSKLITTFFYEKIDKNDMKILFVGSSYIMDL